MELLTLSASLLRSDQCDYILKGIKTFAEIDPGEECIRLDGIRFKGVHVSHMLVYS